MMASLYRRGLQLLRRLRARQRERERQVIELGASGLFDARWYRQSYPDVPQGGEILHYLDTGWRIGFNPSPRFDCAAYLMANVDVARAGMNPVIHYIRYGREEGRALPGLPDAGSASGRGPKADASISEHQVHSPEILQDAVVLRQSGLFDETWYRSTYGVPTGDDALLHYLSTGWRLGHNPSPRFDQNFYLETYRDVADAGDNPVLHYIRHGRIENRMPAAPAASVDAASIAGDLDAVRASGLFDPDWYTERYGDSIVGDPLVFYIASGWTKGHQPGPSFNGSFYLETYPDVAEAGFNPLVHYVSHGMSEGRLALPDPFAPHALQSVLARFQLDPAAAEETIRANLEHHQWPRFARGAKMDVFVHSRGNIFMREIAELVTAGAIEAGFAARLCHEDEFFRAKAESTHSADAVAIIVAPHEFFVIEFQGRKVPMHWAAGAVLLNVEQLHTGWFKAGLPAIRTAAAVLDISLQSAAVLAHLKLPSAYLPLGYVKDFARLAVQETLPDVTALRSLERAIKQTPPVLDAPLSTRPIDVFFIGYLSQRRSGIFERFATRLSKWRCHFVLTDGDRPLVSGDNAILESEATIGLVQRSKIVLNLHQSDEPFFEWHRIVLQGIWQRALVVSEPLALQSKFLSGTHFLEAPLDELADLIDWLLETEAGMQTAEKIRMRAFDHLTQQVSLGRELQTLFLDDCHGTTKA
ncbi:hypothetical protein SAMN05880590_104320 [Rhizobium sp. RU35A]|uniref:hypothetical protein n=1 Tax=Rhizobium sp. RU35A TaxID=1907414 RepID=UPI000954AA6C|nr:hypothetical protein [Rhizobium sp. RU35A]SIQ48857.1 hypothetical protein SAMN05880590_104320 [Rhizobium sp. RU35A]